MPVAFHHVNLSIPREPFQFQETLLMLRLRRHEHVYDKSFTLSYFEYVKYFNELKVLTWQFSSVIDSTVLHES